jgi:hypothetical protein
VGADPRSVGRYPAFFARRELLAYDVFLVVVIAAGAVLVRAAIVLARGSRFARPDGAGRMIASTVLLLLGAALLFTRLVAVTGT